MTWSHPEGGREVLLPGPIWRGKGRCCDLVPSGGGEGGRCYDLVPSRGGQGGVMTWSHPEGGGREVL